MRLKRLLEEQCIGEDDDPTDPDGDGPEGAPVCPKDPQVEKIPVEIDSTASDRDAGDSTDSDDPVTAQHDPANGPQCRIRDPLNDAVNGDNHMENNERQQWAIEQMQVNGEFRKADLIEQFECSTTTAERDLREPRRCGLIEFVGPAKTGFWRIVT